MPEARNEILDDMPLIESSASHFVARVPTLAQHTIVERKGDDALDRHHGHTLAHPSEVKKQPEPPARAEETPAPAPASPAKTKRWRRGRGR